MFPHAQSEQLRDESKGADRPKPSPTGLNPSGWPVWSPRLTRENSILLSILAVTCVAYSRSLGNGFVLDDFVVVVKNPDLRNWSFLWKGFSRSEYWFSDAGWIQAYYYRNYRPLLLVWYWVDYHLFGLNPAPWRASVIAIHLLVVWLVFKICRRLASGSTPALLAASLFALTPIHVADVVWIACCGMVLGTALTLAAFYLIMPRAGRTTCRWTAAIALYAGALLCHESMAAFPALVACYVFLLDPNEPEAGAVLEPNGISLWMRARRAVIWQAPFAVELLIYMFVRRLVLGFFVSNPYYYINLLTDAQALLTVPLVLATYLAMLLMPWLTLPNHRAPLVSRPLSPDFWVPLAAIALVGAALVVVVRRDPRRRLHLFCAAWMGVTFVPMMMLHSVPHLIQDYCLYLPSVGWCILLADLIAGTARQNAFARRLVLGGTCAMLVIYAIALWRVEWFWHDDVAAARGYVEGDPESIEWRWNLATHLDKQGDLSDAEQETRIALSLEPDRTGNIFVPHSNDMHRFLGEILAERGDIDRAELEFGKSVNGPPDEDEKHPTRPPLAYNHDGLSLYDQGLHDAKTGRTDQAIEEITQGLAMMKQLPVPDYGPLAMRYIELAELYDSIGRKEQVEVVLNEVDSMPEGELAAGLARVKIRLNHSDKQGAERILRELSDRYPTNHEVWMQLADLESELKQYDQALIGYQRASEGWYGDPRLHLSMARMLYALGGGREALNQCRLAVALSPGNWGTKATCDWIRTNVESSTT